MTEYISKDLLKKHLEEKISYMTLENNEAYEEWWGVTEMVIDTIPTIIRCENCYWSGEPPKEWGIRDVVWCKSHGCLRNPRWFCADGRKHNE